MVPTELLGKIAALWGQMHCWFWPLGRIGICRVDIARSVAILEIPDLDRIGFDLQHVVSESIVVEGLAEGVGFAFKSATILCRVLHVKTLGVAAVLNFTTVDVNRAICACVEGLNASGCVVDVFDKVNFGVGFIRRIFTYVDPATCYQRLKCLRERTE
jgi:hypothetical protein